MMHPARLNDVISFLALGSLVTLLVGYLYLNDNPEHQTGEANPEMSRQNEEPLSSSAIPLEDSELNLTRQIREANGQMDRSGNGSADHSASRPGASSLPTHSPGIPDFTGVPEEGEPIRSVPQDTMFRSAIPLRSLTQSQWSSYKARFITDDGRVIDTGNDGVSHTEGQGYAMLLAVAHDDLLTFRKLWRWTHANLRLRDDGLFVWRWDPQKTPHVDDNNAAADGDLLIAWALQRAAERWQIRDYMDEAIRISQLIREELIREIGGYTVLLPGPDWFMREDGSSLINLSYWVFPAFHDLDRIDPAPEWAELERSGLALLKAGRKSHFHLPPDWLLLQQDGQLDFVADMNQAFGYNGVRIPLYLIWANLDGKEQIEPFADFWFGTQAGTPPPMVADLAQGRVTERISDRDMMRIAVLTRCAAAAEGLRYGSVADPVNREIGRGGSNAEISAQYYPASLGLIVDIVLMGRSDLCTG